MLLLADIGESHQYEKVQWLTRSHCSCRYSRILDARSDIDEGCRHHHNLRSKYALPGLLHRDILHQRPVRRYVVSRATRPEQYHSHVTPISGLICWKIRATMSSLVGPGYTVGILLHRLFEVAVQTGVYLCFVFHALESRPNFDCSAREAAFYCAHLLAIIVTDSAGTNLYFIFLDCVRLMLSPMLTCTGFTFNHVSSRQSRRLYSQCSSSEPGWRHTQSLRKQCSLPCSRCQQVAETLHCLLPRLWRVRLT